MKPRLLYVGTPCHDSRMHKTYHTSIVNLANCGRYNLLASGMSGGGVCVARNKLAHLFIKSAADRILWVDADISFTPEDVDQLWERDLPIVGGLYAHKTAEEIRWSARGAGKEPEPNGLVELFAVGTGFLMIKKSVFKEMTEQWPEDRYIEDWADGRDEEKYAFFYDKVVCDPEYGIEKPTLLSEDWFFAYRARRLGYRVYADTNVQLGHWEGGICFPVQKPEEVNKA